MKALSIIGVIISSLGLFFGLVELAKGTGDVGFAGVLTLFGSVYFLAFSIVSIVVISKNKKS